MTSFKRVATTVLRSFSKPITNLSTRNLSNPNWMSTINKKKLHQIVHHRLEIFERQAEADTYLDLIRDEPLMRNTIDNFIPDDLDPLIQSVLAPKEIPVDPQVKSKFCQVYDKDILSPRTSLILLMTRLMGSDITSKHTLLVEAIQSHVFASIFHDCITDTKKYTRDTLLFNKVCVLVGDHFLAHVNRKVSMIHNCMVVDLISRGTQSRCEGNFVNVTDVPSWMERTFLTEGAMESYGLKSAVVIANPQAPRLQDAAFDFGKNLSLLRSIRREVDEYMSPPDTMTRDLTTSLPFLQAMSDEDEVSNMTDPRYLYEISLERGGINKTLNLLTQVKESCLDSLSNFPSCPERHALETLVNSYLITYT